MIDYQPTYLVPTRFDWPYFMGGQSDGERVPTHYFAPGHSHVVTFKMGDPAVFYAECPSDTVEGRQQTYRKERFAWRINDEKPVEVTLFIPTADAPPTSLEVVTRIADRLLREQSGDAS